MKSYFNVVRVYPAVDGIYDWMGMSSEFLEMNGIDRWLSLRESNSLIDYSPIKEPLEVFIRKDIKASDLENVRKELKDNLRQFLVDKSDELYKEFDETVGNSTIPGIVTEAEAKLESGLSSLYKELNEKFTEYLTTHFEKITF